MVEFYTVDKNCRESVYFHASLYPKTHYTDVTIWLTYVK